MAKKNAQKTIKLQKVRLSFPDIFEPKAVNQGDKPAYSGDFILPSDHPQLEEVKETIKQVAQYKWDEDAPGILKKLKQSDKICLHNGNKKTDATGTTRDGYEGNFYLSARSYVKPTVVDRNPRVAVTEEDGKIYSGCYVNCFLAIWAQSNQFGKRINAQLQGVQFHSEGESFGAGKAADPSVFDSLEDEFEDGGEEIAAGEGFDDDII